MFPARSSVVSTIPSQNTARRKKKKHFFCKPNFHHHIRFSTLGMLVDPCSGHLNMFAVVASCWKLYSPEGDRTLERNLNRRLLHAILSVERRVARRRCHAAEVPLNFCVEEQGEEHSA